MKSLKPAARAGGLLAAAGAAAILGYALFLRSENRAPENTPASAKQYRLLDAMHELQTYSTKLYFAGTAKNEDLATWYSRKVKQTVLNIQERRTEPYAYNGWDAAELAIMLDAPLAGINEIIETGQWDEFEGEFDFLMDACNACHTATEHAFVVVRAPKGEQAPLNQNFESAD